MLGKRSRRARAFGPSLLVLGALSGRIGTAQAQPGDADALFQSGLRAMQSGDYDTACPLLERSYREDPLPGALFTLAECEVGGRKVLAAIEHYRSFLDIIATLPSARRDSFEERRRVAAEKLAALTRPAEAAPPPVVAPPPAPRADRAPAMVHVDADPVTRRWAWIAGGVGVAGLLTGAITGGMAFGDKSTADNNCPNHLCNAAGQSAVSAGRGAATVSTVAFSVGLIGAGTSVVLFLLAPRNPRPAEVSFHGLRPSIAPTAGGATLSLHGDL